jgi:hypothetical protein
MDKPDIRLDDPAFFYFQYPDGYRIGWLDIRPIG